MVMMADSFQKVSMRIAVLLVVFCVMVTWSIVCVQKGELIPLDTNSLSALGIAFGSKMWSKYVEKEPIQK